MNSRAKELVNYYDEYYDDTDNFISFGLNKTEDGIIIEIFDGERYDDYVKIAEYFPEKDILKTDWGNVIGGIAAWKDIHYWDLIDGEDSEPDYDTELRYEIEAIIGTITNAMEDECERLQEYCGIINGETEY